MKRFILPIAALVMLLAPGIASAQSQSCWYFYCESFASWAPGYNQVQGYSRMSDWYYGVEMEVDGCVYDPDLGWIYLDYAYGTYEVFVDENYSTSDPGQYYTGGDNYYFWGSPGWWWY